MGRPTLQDGLNDFQKWLVSSNSKSVNTAKNYAWCVRKIKNALQDKTGTLTSHMAIDAIRAEFPKKQSAAAKAAWNAYVDYESAVFNRVYPDARAESIRREIREPKKEEVDIHLPQNIKNILRRFQASLFSFSEISTLTWDKVDLKMRTDVKGDNHFSVFLGNDRYAKLSLDEIKQLIEYNNPGKDMSFPLVPYNPPSNEFCTPEYLSKELRSIDKPILDIIAELEVKIRDQPIPISPIAEKELEEEDEMLMESTLMSIGQ